VPNVGQDWIITPIWLTGNQEIIFEPGVVVAAREGYFHGTHDSLFRADDRDNITITAYGATFKMQKADYMDPGLYVKAAWRSAFFLNSVANFTLRGGTIRDTGGDGVLLSHWGRGYNDNVTIQDVVFENNYRQGISVISAQNLLIQNCVFNNTSGTGPAAGSDLEPDETYDRLVNIVIRDCVADNNQGSGYIVSPANLDSSSLDISILLENCDVISGQSHGLMVSGVDDNGPGGTIEFKNCDVANTRLHGIRILDKSSTRASVEFDNCTFTNVAWGPEDAGGYEGVPNLPMMIHTRASYWTTHPGGVTFTDVVVTDDQDRATLACRDPNGSATGLYDVHGNITVYNGPYTARADWGYEPLYNVDVTISEGAPEPATIALLVVGGSLALFRRRKGSLKRGTVAYFPNKGREKR